MFVKHYDPLRRYVTILHDARANVIRSSVTLLSDHRGSFPAMVFCEAWNKL